MALLNHSRDSDRGRELNAPVNNAGNHHPALSSGFWFPGGPRGGVQRWGPELGPRVDDWLSKPDFNVIHPADN